jgi:hypothetical protein
MLKFPDDTQVSVIGLNEIMAELYHENKKADDETIDEIIRRLEMEKNYIPSSERVRKEYSYVLLNEYRRFLKEKADTGE